MSLLDLPVDILLLIFPYLDATSFLHLTSTCTALHNPDFLHDAAFWSSLVRTTFRVPNQPTAQHDGKRWQKLYKRLLTQSRIYTWGDNDKACLGHSYDAPGSLAHLGPPRARRVNALRRRHISWPAELRGTEGLGVISDVQCGGWSTTLLTAKGSLYTVGVLDGLQFDQRRPPFMQTPAMRPTALKYPPGFALPHERHEPSTAVQQFSAGRAHVLGLSDSGRIWSWQNIEHAGLHVKFLNHDTKEDGSASGRGTVHKVVAGWNKSGALVEGTGIVLWDPLQRGHDDTAVEDAALILESAVVPMTGYRRPRGKSPWKNEYANDPRLAENVSQVENFVLLEHVLLFSTDIGKVFVAQIFWSDTEQRVAEPVEIVLPDPGSEAFATDVQGSFRSFAIFTRDGTVLTSNQDRLMDLLREGQAPDNLFTRIPALQHKGVISVAFGDYHFHALHSSGYITSYGNEPQACGALGLGGHGDPEGRLRGIRYQGMGGDGRLVPHAYTEGRRVWFEEEKRDWIRFLTAGGVNPEEAAQRMRMALGSPDIRCQGEVSEWIEQQGRDWESKFGLKSEEDDDLGAYFALSVTAAGWHSGALVLVNEDLAAKVQAACEVRDPSLPVEEAEQEEQDPKVEDASSSIFSYAVATALDYGRWFLGLAPYNVSAPPPHSGRNATTTEARANNRTEQIHVPRNYGDSPREGYKYVWANDHFPRLRLSNGVEMPGEVAFDEWRYERPEFDLDAAL